jgi:hypothetical protein
VLKTPDTLRLKNGRDKPLAPPVEQDGKAVSNDNNAIALHTLRLLNGNDNLERTTFFLFSRGLCHSIL